MAEKLSESATHILVEAKVRYWEDAVVNDEEDTEGGLVPGRVGDMWKVWIDLAAGRIEDWPEGTTASIHYKVCDTGEYWLTDTHGNKLAKREGYYVPDEFLCHGDRGFGDYITRYCTSRTQGRLPHSILPPCEMRGCESERGRIGSLCPEVPRA